MSLDQQVQMPRTHVQRLFITVLTFIRDEDCHVR